MILNTDCVLAVVIFCYIILPIILLFIRNKKVQKWLIVASLLAYLIILIVGTFSKFTISKDQISITFESTGVWCGKHIYLDFYRVSKWDFLINLFMLLPIGLCVGYFSKDIKFSKFSLRLFITGLAIGLTIETLQFILPVPRMVQLSDVILNTISVVLGGYQYFLYKKIFNKNSN